MQEINFEYFQGMEAEQYSFYRVPKALFTAEYFKSLSCEAKVLYGLLLDRMSLSIKNRWFDKDDRVYIIFTVEEIAELMNCGTQKAVRLLRELDTDKGIGLIEKKRLGLGKPNIIYVKNFMVKQTGDGRKEEKQPEKPENTQNDENHNSGMVKITNQECPESQFQNDENHNSGMMKTTNQENTESQFQNGENHNSGMMKITNQEYPKSLNKNDENHNSGIVKIINQECLKSLSNNTDIINTEYNETDYSNTEVSETDTVMCESLLSNPSINQEKRTMDVIEEMDTYRQIIRENISYECYQSDCYIQEIVERKADHITFETSGFYYCIEYQKANVNVMGAAA